MVFDQVETMNLQTAQCLSSGIAPSSAFGRPVIHIGLALFGLAAQTSAVGELTIHAVQFTSTPNGDQ